MSLKVVDRLPKFRSSLGVVMNDALREASRDVLVKAKTKAPYQKGQLRSDSQVKMERPLLWKISFFKEYARYQEFGGDGKRTIKNYTTSGTGKRFLSKSGDEVSNKMSRYLIKHAKRARA